MGAHMQVVTSTAASSSPPWSPVKMEEEERYVKVASRFYRVKPASGGARVRLHYLESCFLCKNNIASDRDISMYKGDAAFCSEECREEQMDMDEALHAVARSHRLLQHYKTPLSAAGTAEATASRPPMMHRRPTIANLRARTPVAAS